MGEVEDLSTKAARLWLEFLQAQAKAAASAAEKLPEMARSWAALSPLSQANHVSGGSTAAAAPRDDANPGDTPQQNEERLPQPSPALAAGGKRQHPALLVRANHRRLKATQKSLARRRGR